LTAPSITVSGVVDVQLMAALEDPLPEFEGPAPGFEDPAPALEDPSGEDALDWLWQPAINAMTRMTTVRSVVDIPFMMTSQISPWVLPNSVVIPIVGGKAAVASPEDITNWQGSTPPSYVGDKRRKSESSGWAEGIPIAKLPINA
jgi:hypothetical protein